MSAAPPDPARVDLRGVTRRFGRTGHVALDALDATFGDGTRIGIVGESGSGKSTLARIVAGLDRPTSGEVDFNGRPVAQVLGTSFGARDFRRAVQLVGQDTTSSFDPRRTLRDALRQPAVRLLGLDRHGADARIDELVARLGIPAAAVDRRPGELSGGQRQRVSLARALIVGPRLLLCDEVVSALDVSVQGSILNTIKRYCVEAGAGLVFVSHGLPATAFVSEHMIVMFRGRIVEQGPTGQIVTAPEHPYTRSLLAAAGRPAVAA